MTLLFNRITRFITKNDIDLIFDRSDTYFSVFPNVDPQTQGGELLKDPAQLVRVDHSTGDKAQIVYFDNNTKITYTEYLSILAPLIETVDVSVRTKLHRPGFIVFSPNLSYVDYHTINIKDGSKEPSEDEVYSALMELLDVLESTKYKTIRFKYAKDAIKSGREILSDKSTIQLVLKEMMKEFFKWL